jgi:hypothetical protein
VTGTDGGPGHEGAEPERRQPALDGGRSEIDEALRRRAVRVLVRNWRGASTVPSAALYPHQWSWDSAFVAIGLARWAQRRAQTELASLFGGQWADGRMPHIVFNPAVPEKAYFPGASFWRSRRASPSTPTSTSGIVQPPLHAVAALAVVEHAREPERALGFARRIYPRLTAQSLYLSTCRTVAGLGLAGLVHPWESGLDNSPAWDAPMAAIPADLGLLRVHRRRDLQNAGVHERPTDQDYARYVRLAIAYRDAGYDDLTYWHDAEFCVVDPLVNALWAWSEDALAELAMRIGADPAPHRDRAEQLVEAMCTNLFDEALGTFVAYDVRQGSRIPVRTVGGLVPLVLAGLPAHIVERLLATLRSASFGLGDQAVHGIPSYDLTAADFDGHRYWRGPAWHNTSWLIWRGLQVHGRHLLASQLRADMLSLAASAGFREYFDPRSGRGHGAHQFSWSAALAIDLLEEPTGELSDRL